MALANPDPWRPSTARGYPGEDEQPSAVNVRPRRDRHPRRRLTAGAQRALFALCFVVGSVAGGAVGQALTMRPAASMETTVPQPAAVATPVAAEEPVVRIQPLRSLQER
jgi:hypothetical protein